MGGQIPGISRGLHQRIGAPAAEGKLGHVQFAKRHHACLQQSLHRGTGLRASPINKMPGTQRADLTFDIEQVFEDDRQSMQWAQGQTRRTPLIGTARQGSRLLGIDLGEGMQGRLRLVDPMQQRLRQLER